MSIMVKHQLQPNTWSCLPTSFAICLNVDVVDIFDYLEHDGSDIVFPDLNDPYCRRSFHPQELIDYCYFKHNVKVMTIENDPELMTNYSTDIYSVPMHKDRLKKYLNVNMPKVLSGIIKNNLKCHAVADINNTIYDPNGIIYTRNTFLDNFNIQCLFLIIT